MDFNEYVLEHLAAERQAEARAAAAAHSARWHASPPPRPRARMALATAIAWTGHRLLDAAAALAPSPSAVPTRRQGRC